MESILKVRGQPWHAFTPAAPSEDERAAAESALDEVYAELPGLRGGQRFDIAWYAYRPDMGALAAHWNPDSPDELCIRTGLRPRDVRAMVRHEAAHAAYYHRYGQASDDASEALSDRYARGDGAAIETVRTFVPRLNLLRIVAAHPPRRPAARPGPSTGRSAPMAAARSALREYDARLPVAVRSILAGQPATVAVADTFSAREWVRRQMVRRARWIVGTVAPLLGKSGAEGLRMMWPGLDPAIAAEALA